MKELLLLRHGKSDRDIKVDDFDRPLKKRGIFEARRMGKWLKKKQLVPDVFLSSPAKRAIDTAKIVLCELGVDSLLIQTDKALYATDLYELKTVLADYSHANQRVLLVGHNPELEDLLIHLVGENAVPKTGKLLTTTTLARLTLSSEWDSLHEGCAQLVSIICAKSLN